VSLVGLIAIPAVGDCCPDGVTDWGTDENEGKTGVEGFERTGPSASLVWVLLLPYGVGESTEASSLTVR
jgi:hypothetical protein